MLPPIQKELETLVQGVADRILDATIETNGEKSVKSLVDKVVRKVNGVEGLPKPDYRLDDLVDHVQAALILKELNARDVVAAVKYLREAEDWDLELKFGDNITFARYMGVAPVQEGLERDL